VVQLGSGCRPFVVGTSHVGGTDHPVRVAVRIRQDLEDAIGRNVDEDLFAGVPH
jgi:hypothetical protein